MADNEDKKDGKTAPSAKPGFDPKPVQLGGESLLERLLPYMKQIVIFLVGVAVIISIVFMFKHFKERAREKETTKLASVLDIANREVKDPSAPADPNDPSKKKEPTFATAKERAQAILDELDKKGATAAGPTYKGALLVEVGKFDAAITEYKKAEDAKGLEGVLAREGLGIALESKAEAEKDAATRQKGLEDALAVFQKMQPDEKGPRAGYAFYHQGRILGLLGRNADAKTALEKAKELVKDGELPNLIDERLAMLGGS